MTDDKAKSDGPPSLKECIPSDDFDIAAIDRAKSVGFPALNPAIPDLLEWVQDANWPVAEETALLLSDAGPAIVPVIKKVLAALDGVWKYWILEIVIPKLDPGVVALLHEDIVRLATAPTVDDRTEEADVAARDILARR